LAIFIQQQHLLDKYQIQTGFLFNNISTNCVAVEPLFFWPDAVDQLHKASVEADYYRKVPALPENLEARAVVALIRQQVADYFSAQGAVHLQIGKSYQYVGAIKPEALALVQAIKKAVDPAGRMNPGVLGL
jgi:FAD/FMN-containing dehydrogenase